MVSVIIKLLRYIRYDLWSLKHHTPIATAASPTVFRVTIPIIVFAQSFFELHNSHYFSKLFFFDFFSSQLAVLFSRNISSCPLLQRPLPILEELPPCLQRQKLPRSQLPNVSYYVYAILLCYSACFFAPLYQQVICTIDNL